VFAAPEETLAEHIAMLEKGMARTGVRAER
jgi:hypothetical protein